MGSQLRTRCLSVTAKWLAAGAMGAPRTRWSRNSVMSSGDTVRLPSAPRSGLRNTPGVGTASGKRVREEVGATFKLHEVF